MAVSLTGYLSYWHWPTNSLQFVLLITYKTRGGAKKKVELEIEQKKLPSTYQLVDQMEMSLCMQTS